MSNRDFSTPFKGDYLSALGTTPKKANPTTPAKDSVGGGFVVHDDHNTEYADEDGPLDPDGPWAKGWNERVGDDVDAVKVLLKVIKLGSPKLSEDELSCLNQLTDRLEAYRSSGLLSDITINIDVIRDEFRITY